MKSQQPRLRQLFDAVHAGCVQGSDAHATGVLRSLLHECGTQLSLNGFCEKVAELQLPDCMLAHVAATEGRWPILSADQLDTGCLMWQQTGLSGRMAATEVWVWSLARHDRTSRATLSTDMADILWLDAGSDCGGGGDSGSGSDGGARDEGEICAVACVDGDGLCYAGLCCQTLYTSVLLELMAEFTEMRRLGLEYYEYFGREEASPLSDEGVDSDEGYNTGEDPESVEHAVLMFAGMLGYMLCGAERLHLEGLILAGFDLGELECAPCRTVVCEGTRWCGMAMRSC